MTLYWGRDAETHIAPIVWLAEAMRRLVCSNADVHSLSV